MEVNGAKVTVILQNLRVSKWWIFIFGWSIPLSKTCTYSKNALTVILFKQKMKEYWDCNGNIFTYLVSALSMSTKNYILYRNKIYIKHLSNNLRGEGGVLYAYLNFMTFPVLKSIEYTKTSPNVHPCS